MFSSPIKSRPQYSGLKPMPSARRHLIAAEGEGARAVRDLFAKADAEFATRAHILYAVREDGAGDRVEQLQALGPDRLDVHQSSAALLSELDKLLDRATMGTRLYVTGTEGFVGQVMTLAIDHGVDHHSIVTEHSGSLARRVQCVHCKGFTEEVRVSIFECGHCGNLLFVRDHYSRRLAAFQGVAINAEEPGSRPVAEEIYN